MFVILLREYFFSLRFVYFKEVERVAKVPIKPKKVAVAVKSMFVIFCVKSNPKFWKL